MIKVSKSQKRLGLKKLNLNTRHEFTAIWDHTGQRYKYKNELWCNALVKNVVVNATGELVTDHIWINLKLKDLKLLGVAKGDIIVFDGRIDKYMRTNYTKDYNIKTYTIKRRIACGNKCRLVR